MEKPGRKDQQELRQSVFRALRATEHSPYSSSATRLLGQQKLVSPLSLLETWREIFQFVGINCCVPPTYNTNSVIDIGKMQNTKRKVPRLSLWTSLYQQQTA